MDLVVADVWIVLRVALVVLLGLAGYFILAWCKKLLKKVIRWFLS